MGGRDTINIAQQREKACIKNALHATRAAVEEGIVPGGGVALLRDRAAISGLTGVNADQNAGIQIVLRAMEEPLRQIVQKCWRRSFCGREPCDC